MLECWPPFLDAGAVPPRGRREVDASRRLDRRECYLPWACFTLADWHSPVKRPTGRPRCAVTIRAAAAVCLKAVNAGLRRRGPRRVIAAWAANKPPDAGDAGRPVNAIAPPTTAKADAATRADVTAAVSGNGRRPPSPRCRATARASAQQHFSNKTPALRANVPVATPALRRARVRRSSVSVAPPAVRLYAVSANGRSHAGNAAAGECGRDVVGHGRRPEFSSLRRRVLHPPAPEHYLASTPTQREERVGR